MLQERQLQFEGGNMFHLIAELDDPSDVIINNPVVELCFMYSCVASLGHIRTGKATARDVAGL